MVICKWIFLFFTIASLSLVHADTEFRTSSSGLLIIGPQDNPVPSNKSDFMNRLNTLRTNVVPGNDWNFPGQREIRKSLIDDLNSLRVHSLDRQGPILNRIRLGLTVLQQQQPELMREKLSNGSTRTRLSHPSSIEMDRLTDREDVPNYCSHYPILQRSEIEDHYSGAQNGEQFTCHQVSQHRVGLDLKDIGNILGNMENSRYSQSDDTLKEDLLQVSTAGILRESAAYSGLYPDTNPDLAKLKSCARNKPKLKSLIEKHENTLPERVNAHNELYQNEGQDRKETFLKENIKQALIVGNLYHLQRRGGAENRRIEAGARARAIAICRAEQEERSGFYYIPSTVRSQAVYLNRLCRRRTSRGDFNTQMECRTAYTRLSGQASFRSDYETCMSNQGTPNTFNLEALVPLMAGKIDSFPLLFDRKDNLNLLPFTESKSEFVPSDFSKKIKDLDGADEISEAIKTALLANPHDPEGAINSVMESSPWKESIDTLVNNAKSSAEVNNVFKDEIKEYQEEIIESAEKTCDNNAENLHHFPKLIEEVIARRLNEPNLSTEEKKTILAEAQAAQCHLLQREPPDETGGLPTALTVIGVAGAIAMGLVPGVGWAIAGAALATTIGATDGMQRRSVATDRYHATFSAAVGGYATNDDVLAAAGDLTDANITLASEALLVGGEGLLLLRSARNAARANPRRAAGVTEEGGEFARGNASRSPTASTSADRIPMLSSPGLPRRYTSADVPSSVGHLDTHEELMRFKGAFRDDVLARFGLKDLQDYSDPAKIGAFRNIYEEFLENGRGIVLQSGDLNPAFLTQLEEARRVMGVSPIELNTQELDLLKQLGRNWDEQREIFGAARVELGDLRSVKLRSELEEMGLPSAQTRDVDCGAVRRLSQGFPPSGKNCFAFNTKDQGDNLKGNFCSCGNGLSATNWLIRCPRRGGEFLSKTNYYDQLALFKNESVNCFRVDVPDNVTCFAGPAGPRRGGLGGMSQIFCPKRPGGDVRVNLTDNPVNNQSQLNTLDEVWDGLGIPDEWHLIRPEHRQAIINNEGRPFELGPDIKRNVVAWSPNPGHEGLSRIVQMTRDCVKRPTCDNMELEQYFDDDILPNIATPITERGRIVRYELREDSNIPPDEWRAVRIYYCQHIVKNLRDPSCTGLAADEFPRIPGEWHP